MQVEYLVLCTILVIISSPTSYNWVTMLDPKRLIKMLARCYAYMPCGSAKLGYKHVHSYLDGVVSHVGVFSLRYCLPLLSTNNLCGADMMRKGVLNFNTNQFSFNSIQLCTIFRSAQTDVKGQQRALMEIPTTKWNGKGRHKFRSRAFNKYTRIRTKILNV